MQYANGGWLDPTRIECVAQYATGGWLDPTRIEAVGQYVNSNGPPAAAPAVATYTRLPSDKHTHVCAFSHPSRFLRTSTLPAMQSQLSGSLLQQHYEMLAGALISSRAYRCVVFPTFFFRGCLNGDGGMCGRRGLTFCSDDLRGRNTPVWQYQH